jgi:hypothetical protein
MRGVACRAPWHASQMAWLENHLNLINVYATALENLENYKGIKSTLLRYIHYTLIHI